MIADRPYRKGRPAQDARSELVRCAGTQFDPAVVRAFLGTLHDSAGSADGVVLGVIDHAIDHAIDDSVIPAQSSSAVAGLAS